ncbi:conserved hypothetical protein [Trichinella spiralis]|uniref:hypothetical protein n=1 Tax=Trichinella spiralis TaxID=6334 RepID=UPI0001EFE111|nr:conserved hypothetical protein [Trichinella spiralis]
MENKSNVKNVRITVISVTINIGQRELKETLMSNLKILCTNHVWREPKETTRVYFRRNAKGHYHDNKITQPETTDSLWFIRMYSNIECNVSLHHQWQSFFWPTLSSIVGAFSVISVVFRAMLRRARGDRLLSAISKYLPSTRFHAGGVCVCGS